MLTIISATNRNDNQTEIFAKHCKESLRSSNEEIAFFSLNDLPNELPLESVYEQETSIFASIAEKYIIPADKFLFVIPEYNGSFPGILKLFIDGIAPKHLSGKKACLIGVSAGHAGNLRGMDHFADVLNYLNVVVMPKKLSIARIGALIAESKLMDERTLASLDKQAAQFLEF